MTPHPADAGVVDRFWEVEQERLLLALGPVLSDNRGRLVLPDVGDRAVLAEELARDTRPTIVHLSGHGGPKEIDGQPRQVVYLEEEDGHRAAATSEDLLGWIRARGDLDPPSLMVLSACDTASGMPPRSPSPGGKGEPVVGRHARSLAEDLLRGGLPRTLGMQTSISDAGATEFAGAFYAALARGADLVLALREGRAALRDRGAAQNGRSPCSSPRIISARWWRLRTSGGGSRRHWNASAAPSTSGTSCTSGTATSGAVSSIAACTRPGATARG